MEFGVRLILTGGAKGARLVANNKPKEIVQCREKTERDLTERDLKVKVRELDGEKAAAIRGRKEGALLVDRVGGKATGTVRARASVMATAAQKTLVQLEGR